MGEVYLRNRFAFSFLYANKVNTVFIVVFLIINVRKISKVEITFRITGKTFYESIYLLFDIINKYQKLNRIERTVKKRCY